MLSISTEKNTQTVITTYDVTPGTFMELLGLLQDAYENFLRHQPGFIAAALHVNDARTRIANYSRWRGREDFQAVLRSEEMQARNRVFSDLSKSFAPVMYEVVQVYEHEN